MALIELLSGMQVFFSSHIPGTNLQRCENLQTLWAFDMGNTHFLE